MTHRAHRRIVAVTWLAALVFILLIPDDTPWYFWVPGNLILGFWHSGILKQLKASCDDCKRDLPISSKIEP